MGTAIRTSWPSRLQATSLVIFPNDGAGGFRYAHRRGPRHLGEWRVGVWCIDGDGDTGLFVRGITFTTATPASPGA